MRFVSCTALTTASSVVTTAPSSSVAEMSCVRRLSVTEPATVKPLWLIFAWPLTPAATAMTSSSPDAETVRSCVVTAALRTNALTVCVSSLSANEPAMPPLLETETAPMPATSRTLLRASTRISSSASVPVGSLTPGPIVVVVTGMSAIQAWMSSTM